VISGIAMTVRNTGAAIGVATFSLLFVLVSKTISVDDAMSVAQRDAGFHAAFLFGLVISVVILVSAIFSHEKVDGADPDRN